MTAWLCDRAELSAWLALTQETRYERVHVPVPLSPRLGSVNYDGVAVDTVMVIQIHVAIKANGPT